MANKKFTIALDDKNTKLYEALKADKSTNELMGYLLSLANLKVKPRGATNVELKLIKLLNTGHDCKITPVELQRETGSNLNICKSVMDLYSDDIELFNKKFD